MPEHLEGDQLEADGFQPELLAFFGHDGPQLGLDPDDVPQQLLDDGHVSVPEIIAIQLVDVLDTGIGKEVIRAWNFVGIPGPVEEGGVLGP